MLLTEQDSGTEQRNRTVKNVCQPRITTVYRQTRHIILLCVTKSSTNPIYSNIIYCIDLKYRDIQASANTVDPDQTVWSGSTMFAIPCQFCIFWTHYHMVNWNFTITLMSCSMTKPTKWPVLLANTHISLGICPVWSVFSALSERLRTQGFFMWTAKTDQTRQMHRLIRAFAGCTGHSVGFVMLWLI